MNRRVFLCHASEDKAAVVRPLAAALKLANISHWVDEAELLWGDEITTKINTGLSNADFVIVVLSEHFLSKNYPNAELDAALNRESSRGDQRVLPLMVGDPKIARDVEQRYPLLARKRYIYWDGDPARIVHELEPVLNRSIPTSKLPTHPTPAVPLPAIRRKFRDEDERLFLDESCSEIQTYFGNAAMLFQLAEPRVYIEIEVLSARKFAVHGYLDGQCTSVCTVRVDSFAGIRGIVFVEGQHIRTDDNYTANEIIYVENDGYRLSLHAMGIGSALGEERTWQDSSKAGEYLWKRFIRPFQGN